MATGVLADYGITAELTNVIASAPFTTGKQKLYSNNHVPAQSDSVGSYTESTFTGYAAVTFGTWGSVTVTAHVASVTCAVATFTLTAGTATVYGAFFTDSGGSNLIGACEDPNAPISMNTTVNTYQVTVTLTVAS
jgi:hypothetical protein